MGVIEADDLDSARARIAAPVDVILRVHDEPPAGSLCRIPRRPRVDDAVARAQQQPAALVGRRRPRMRDDGINRRPRNSNSIRRILDS